LNEDNKTRKIFQFDRVFDSTSKQTELFDQLRINQLCKKVVEVKIISLKETIRDTMLLSLFMDRQDQGKRLQWRDTILASKISTNNLQELEDKGKQTKSRKE
jgi:phage gp46-like protein